MKIIHILKGKANPDTMNGVNKVVHQLATEQLRQGLDVEVWGLTRTPDTVKHKHEYPIKLFCIPKNRFKLPEKISQEISSLNVECVFHLHSVFLPELFAVSKALVKHNASYVLTPHSGYNSESMKRNKLKKYTYFHLFDKFIINHAERIQAIGKSEIRDIKNLAANKDVVLIPNGYPVDKSDYTPRNRKEKTPVFCFCGRLALKHKGLDLLIEGFSIYRKNGGKGVLSIIGDGPDRDLLHGLVKINELDEYVVFYGPQFGSKKIDLIEQSSVFIHTSRWDVMPTGCIEAAYLGLPLLLSKETNMGDGVIESNSGIVLENNSSLNIAAALLAFEEKGGIELDEMAKNSFNMVTSIFNWKTLVKKFNSELYMSRDNEI